MKNARATKKLFKEYLKAKQMKNTRITKELFEKCLKSKRIPRKLKKYMKSVLYSIDMQVGALDLLGPYSRLLSAFGAIELLKDIKKVSIND